MSDQKMSIRSRGKQVVLPVFRLGPKVAVVISGKLLKVARVFDEFWLHPNDLLEPATIIEKLQTVSKKPDLFVFQQKLPDVTPKYIYHQEWDNIAVARTDSYDTWLSRISRKARQAITKSQRKGVVTRVVPFTDGLVRGICSIYNEVPVRQGKPFWHYNKAFSVVKHENGTYQENSVFVGAYHKEQLIGFAKLLLNGEVASLMQILSKVSHADKNPTNALLSMAVKVCESNDARYLTYGKYVYGQRERSGLIDFKRNNGFEKIEIPVYYVPLTLKGRVFLKSGLHRGWSSIMPAILISKLVKLRSDYYSLRARRSEPVQKSRDSGA